MERRDLLAAIGTGIAVGTAGCLTGGDPGDEAESESRSTGDDIADGRYAAVYEAAIDSVALVSTRTPPGMQGSAFVYDDAFLVTNHHVVDGASDLDVQFADGDWSDAEVVGSDRHSDLAVVEADDPPAYATPLPLSTAVPVVGQEVLALGNPLGYESSVSRGIISGVDRSLPAPTGFSIPNAIQTDAPIDRGNSGGPLVGLDGDALAVINSGAGDVGFGISAALTRRVVPSLVEDGTFEHSYVGIRSLEVRPRVAAANGLEAITGVIVAEVLEGAPADGVLEGSPDTERVDGIDVPVGGDVIRALDDTEIADQGDLSTYLALETDPGDTVDVTVLRDGAETTVALTLGSRADRPSN